MAASMGFKCDKAASINSEDQVALAAVAAN
jgi:hypothetical protein